MLYDDGSSVLDKDRCQSFGYVWHIRFQCFGAENLHNALIRLFFIEGVKLPWVCCNSRVREAAI